MRTTLSISRDSLIPRSGRRQEEDEFIKFLSHPLQQQPPTTLPQPGTNRQVSHHQGGRQDASVKAEATLRQEDAKTQGYQNSK